MYLPFQVHDNNVVTKRLLLPNFRACFTEKSSILQFNIIISLIFNIIIIIIFFRINIMIITVVNTFFILINFHYINQTFYYILDNHNSCHKSHHYHNCHHNFHFSFHKLKQKKIIKLSSSLIITSFTFFFSPKQIYNKLNWD